QRIHAHAQDLHQNPANSLPAPNSRGNENRPKQANLNAIGCERKARLYTPGFPVPFGAAMADASAPGAPVAIIMGSRSDWPTLQAAAAVLDQLGGAYETKVVSAHRTPDRMYAFAKSARDKGFKVIIAAAGGAAHLPGMTASMTTLPIGEAGATNAGLLAARILALSDPCLAARLQARAEALEASIPETVAD